MDQLKRLKPEEAREMTDAELEDGLAEVNALRDELKDEARVIAAEIDRRAVLAAARKKLDEFGPDVLAAMDALRGGGAAQS